ncbi:hypothetical protein SCANM63S_10310 [Streptomyces canarius]
MRGRGRAGGCTRRIRHRGQRGRRSPRQTDGRLRTHRRDDHLARRGGRQRRPSGAGGGAARVGSELRLQVPRPRWLKVDLLGVRTADPGYRVPVDRPDPGRPHRVGAGQLRGRSRGLRTGRPGHGPIPAVTGRRRLAGALGRASAAVEPGAPDSGEEPAGGDLVADGFGAADEWLGVPGTRQLAVRLLHPPGKIPVGLPAGLPGYEGGELRTLPSLPHGGAVHGVGTADLVLRRTAQDCRPEGSWRTARQEGPALRPPAPRQFLGQFRGTTLVAGGAVEVVRDDHDILKLASESTEVTLVFLDPCHRTEAPGQERRRQLLRPGESAPQRADLVSARHFSGRDPGTSEALQRRTPLRRHTGCLGRRYGRPTGRRFAPDELSLSPQTLERGVLLDARLVGTPGSKSLRDLHGRRVLKVVRSLGAERGGFVRVVRRGALPVPGLRSWVAGGRCGGAGRRRYSAAQARTSWAA